MSFWKKKSELGDEEGTDASGQGEDSSSPSSGKMSSGETSQLPSRSSAGGGSAVAEYVGASAVLLPGQDGSAEDVLARRFGKTRSALGEGTVIQGKLSFDTPVRIDGKLSGEIFSSKALIVGPTGRVDAHIEAATLVILGEVSGKIVASERVELWSGAHLEGTVKTPALIVQEGSFFSGTTEMLAAQVGQLQYGKEPSGKAQSGSQSGDLERASTKGAQASSKGASSSGSSATSPAFTSGSKDPNPIDSGAKDSTAKPTASAAVDQTTKTSSEVKPVTKEARVH